MVHTGGTLGMSGRRPHALKPGAFFRTVRQRVPELTKLAHLEFELFSNLDSCEMQPELWTRLATLLHARLDDFDGAVVTHGTDTLSDTASALSFMLKNLDKPVVLTGAQRPLGEVRSDARLNLIDAVTSALHGPREVTVCFDSHLYRGNRVRKVSIAEYDAFDSPNCPVLGTLGVEARFEKGLTPKGKRTLWPNLVPEVFLLRVFPGLDPTLVLVLAGIALGSLFGAAVSLIKVLADPYNQLPALTFWLLGSLASVRAADVWAILPAVLLGLVPLWFMGFRIDALAMSEDEARALGIETGRVRAAVITGATLATAAVVSLAGQVSWVGLVVPHMARFLFGPAFTRLLPASALLGGGFLLLVDTLARSAGRQEVPLSVLTAVVGTPLFITLLARARRGW